MVRARAAWTKIELPKLAVAAAGCPICGGSVELRVIAGADGRRWLVLTCKPCELQQRAELVGVELGPEIDTHIRFKWNVRAQGVSK